MSARKKQDTRRVCLCCGKKFVPFDEKETGCSPVCRTIIACKSKEDAKKAQAEDIRRKVEATKYIPKLNLKKNPMARVDWVMKLPIEFRGKYSRFFTPEEQEYSKALEREALAEERRYLGYFVKKDKIVLVKGSEDQEPDPQPDTIDNDGTEDED